MKSPQKKRAPLYWIWMMNLLDVAPEVLAVSEPSVCTAGGFALEVQGVGFPVAATIVREKRKGNLSA